MIDVIPGLDLNSRIASEKITREVELPLITSHSIKLNQCQFHFRMAGEQRFLIGTRTEFGKKKIVYKTDARVQQGALSGSPIVGDSTLQEVAHVVKFVAPLLDLRVHSLRSMLADIIGVQVSVGLLRCNDILGDSFDIR